MRGANGSSNFASASERSTGSFTTGSHEEESLRRVDLGLLELPRVVDVDRLPLCEDVERRLPSFAVAVARVLRAAERQVHLGSDRAGVDVGDPRLEVAHR